MQNSAFYDILDAELTSIISENQNNTDLTKLNHITQQNGYALLIWFIQFYAPNKIVHKNNITDGNDDNSCDIIFSTLEDDTRIFYVVQSKWNTKKEDKDNNQPKLLNTDELKKALTDFEAVLQKNKNLGKNERFNEKYNELHEHLAQNGLVKFIFLSLLPHNPNADEVIANFEKKYEPNIKLEIIDIERLKRDFIEFRYKQISVPNPINYQYYNAINDEITIEIERKEDALGKGDHLHVTSHYESYIFLVKPKTIHALFDKYKFYLFAANVRNPLAESNFNKAIEETLLRKPEMFWYFNNGVTAIAKDITPVGVHSTQMTVTGLQIINGAQTIYTIYSAYEKVRNGDRKILDNEARISLRVIKSNNQDTNLDITRYTNSQNPMFRQDFWANDAVQIRLQEASFQTSIWYAKRRDEFRVVPEGITVVDNFVFAKAYLAFWLQKPYLDVHLTHFNENQDSDIFLSEKEKKQGLYEIIFNKETHFDDFLSAYYIYTISEEIDVFLDGNYKYIPDILGQRFTYIALFKIILEKYIFKKYPTGKNISINKIITKLYQEEGQKTLFQLFAFLRTDKSQEGFYQCMSKEFAETEEDALRLLHSNFLQLKIYFENIDFTVHDIENIDIY